MPPIRVLHLIDSLAAGGAERMAVNMFNLLNERGTPAWLCATRTSGPLETQIGRPDRYFCLEKRHFFDLHAFRHFIWYIRKHEINLIHAHSSSLAWAVLVKLFTDVEVIWHDHFGNSEYLSERSKPLLWFFTRFISHVISVNEKLARWAVEELKVDSSKVTYLPNFPVLSRIDDNFSIKSRNCPPVIVCTANLRAAKDHHSLIEALAHLGEEQVPFRLWLIGADFEDEYSRSLKELIASKSLSEKVSFLGVRTDVGDLLAQADIGVLSSVTEGLPVSLLEYGMAGLPVVATAVGQVSEVVGDAGLVVPPQDPRALAEALKRLLLDEGERRKYGKRFSERVRKHFSADSICFKLLDIYQRVLW